MSGTDRLAAWLASAGADPAGTGVFLDFDGTLSPIVEDPSAARPFANAVEVLAQLADRFAVVAVVSGRPGAYLAEHLKGAGRTHLYGLYGLERVGPTGDIETQPGTGHWREAVAAAAAEAAARLPPGASVEPKGLTVTLHYRTAPDQAGAVADLAGSLARTQHLVAHPGKMSVELRPPVEVDKGTVITNLSRGLSIVAFAGDDIGDLPAFAALRRLERAGLVVLAVASAGAETPAEVVEAADVVVDGPAGLVDLLDRLVTPRR